jgi:membrane-bound lytic murein transglycosylase D
MVYRSGLLSLFVLLINISLVFMTAAHAEGASMTTQELSALIKQIGTNDNLQIAATPEVLNKINQIRLNERTRAQTNLALTRIAEHKSSLQTALKYYAVPDDMLALLLIESADEKLYSEATISQINQLHNKFNDWKLAIIAYKYGEEKTTELIQKTGSRDAWEIARSPQAPADLKNYLASFDASIIIVHNPTLVAGS